ncbi:MAG: hypothetical protein JXR05_16510 [Flavobacteriaceae bacterium]
MSKKILILKTISLIALLVITFSGQTFSVTYGMGILFTITERVSELDFSSDFFLNLLCIIGIVLIFFRKKAFILTGYVFATVPLIFYIVYATFSKLDYTFWIPLLGFLILSTYVIFLEFQKDK